MDVIALAHALNERAAKTKSYHFCDPTLSFSHPVYGQLLSLWKDKAGARAMPAKSEISPRDLKSFLGNIVVCQRIAGNPSCYVWRLIGTKVTAVVGDVTGKTFEESAPAGFAARWIECCDLILNGGQPLRFLGRVHIKGREYLDAENFFLPLANDEGEPTFVMGLCRYTPRLYDNDESWESYVASITSSMV